MECLFESPITYDAESLQRASSHVQNVQADLGGTELLQPLQTVLHQPVPAGFARRLILLTDGAVSNSEKVIELVGAHASVATMHTLGVAAVCPMPWWKASRVLAVELRSLWRAPSVWRP